MCGLNSAGGRETLQGIDCSAHLLEATNVIDAPGLAVVVQASARPAVEARGFAHVGISRPLTADSLFRVGSLTKPFTAAAVAHLVAEGVLKWDDGIVDYIPEVGSLLDGIRIRHLVYHTSGLRDYAALDSLAGVESTTTFEGIWRLLRRQRALNFTPGTSFLYSNTGYVLLERIIERASDMPFARMVTDRVLVPLGMHASSFARDDAFDHLDRAFGHVREAISEAHVAFINHEEFFGACGLFTSLGDLLTWSHALGGALCGRKSSDIAKFMVSPGRLDNDESLIFGCGVARSVQFGEDAFVASGRYGGYSAFYLNLLTSNLVMILLTNSGDVSFNTCTRVLTSVSGRAALDSWRNTDRAPWPGACDGESIIPNAKRLAGTFFSEELDAVLTLEAVGESLVLTRPIRTAEIWPTLRDARLAITFPTDVSRRVPGFTLDSRFARGLFCRRVSDSELRPLVRSHPFRVQQRMSCIGVLSCKSTAVPQFVFAPLTRSSDSKIRFSA